MSSEMGPRASTAKPCGVCGSGSKGCSATADGLHFCRGDARPGWKRIGQDEQGFAHYRRADDRREDRQWPAGPTPSAVATPHQLGRLAEALRLPVEALAVLPIGWDGQAWESPEVDAAGEVIGFHRRFPTGKKYVRKDSKRGLVLPRGWRSRQGPVFVVEGLSDTLAATHAGLACVGRPNNAAGAKLLVQLLRDWPAERPIVVVGENDPKPNGDWPGRAGAESLGAKLAKALGRLVTVALPPAGAKDVRDWLTGRTAAGASWPAAGRELADALAAAGTAVAAPAKPPAEPRVSPSQILTDLALREWPVWHDADGVTYADVGRRSERVDSKAFRQRLLCLFRDRFAGGVPGGETLTAAAGAIEAETLRSGREAEACVRVGGAGGNIYLHLADAADTVIEVTPRGWAACDRPPVRFRRPRYLKPLPVPERGGSLDELRHLLNLADEDQFALLLAWLCAALHPAMPYPLLVISGEHGGGKSNATRMLKLLIDPAAAPVQAEPKDARDLLIAAVNCRVLAFDNISHLPPVLSDAFCRLATGGGYGTRELFSNAEELVIDARRPAVLNGIDDFVRRADLLDRSLFLHLPTIPEGKRRTEAEIWRAFEAARPRLLGALLDRVAAGLRERDKVKLTELPRMADFAAFAVACEGGRPGRFLAAYAANQAAANAQAVEESSLAVAVVRLMEARSWSPWEGAAADLLAELNTYGPLDPKPRDWPKTASVLSRHLLRLAPTLRRVHGLDFGRSKGNGKRDLRLERQDDPASRDGNSAA